MHYFDVVLLIFSRLVLSLVTVGLRTVDVGYCRYFRCLKFSQSQTNDQLEG